MHDDMKVPSFRSIALRVRRFLFALRADFAHAIRPDLRGGCAIGSTVLVRVLRRLGHGAELVYGVFRGRGWHSHHAWVCCGGWIIDCTASQFGLPAVHLVRAHCDRRYETRSWGRRASLTVRGWRRAAEPRTAHQSPAVHEREIRRAVRQLVAALG